MLSTPEKPSERFFVVVSQFIEKRPLLPHPRWSLFFGSNWACRLFPFPGALQGIWQWRADNRNFWKQFPLTLPHLFLFQTCHTREKGLSSGTQPHFTTSSPSCIQILLPIVSSVTQPVSQSRCSVTRVYRLLWPLVRRPQCPLSHFALFLCCQDT